jgi:isocitrate dehydrogenase (NAD+)
VKPPQFPATNTPTGAFFPKRKTAVEYAGFRRWGSAGSMKPEAAQNGSVLAGRGFDRHSERDNFLTGPNMQIVLIEGDGIGPEVTQAACRVVAAAGVKVDWVKAAAGIPAAEQFGEPLPEETLEMIRRYRVALKGPCTTPVGKGYRSINVRLRQGLELYASVRPVNTLPGVKTPYDKVDLIVVRENTEGLYAGLEHEVVPGVVESVRLITRPAAERIVRFAFELARHRGRRMVTFCHKADVMRLSDGLFLECARMVADDYPFIQFEEKPVDNVCLELAMDPSQYDVLVM